MTAEQRARLDRIVWVDPGRVSGAPCFRGTRVPVQNLIDFLDCEVPIDEFFEDFPSVSRAQVREFLELAGENLLSECVSS